MNIEQIIKEEEMRILKKEFRFLKEMDEYMITAGGASIISSLILLAVSRFKKKGYIKKGIQHCETLNGQKRNECIAVVKINSAKLQIKELNSVKKECNYKFKDRHDINLCKSKIDEKIKHQKDVIKKYEIHYY